MSSGPSASKSQPPVPTHPWVHVQLLGGHSLFSDRRPTECWATSHPSSVMEAGQSSWANILFRSKPLRPLFTRICICIYVRARQTLGPGALLFLQLGQGLGQHMEAQLWVVHAFQLCCHLCHRATRCGSGGGQRQESFRAFLASEFPVRNTTGRLHLKK